MAGEQEDPAGRAPLVDVVLHPVRLRVLQAMTGREMTTAQLRERLPDIAPATLYRHVAALLEADVLTVVSERKVRGSVERTLAIGPRDVHIGREQAAQVGPDQARQAFASFIGAITGQVDDHLAAERPDFWQGFGFGATILHLDDADLETLQQEIGELIARYQPPAAGKSPSTFATVIVPQGSHP